MSKANGRRVRSLNDIPDVFGNSERRRYNAEPRILKVSLENLSELMEEFYRNKRSIADSLEHGREDEDSGTPRTEVAPKPEKGSMVGFERLGIHLSHSLFFKMTECLRADRTCGRPQLSGEVHRGRVFEEPTRVRREREV